VGPVIRRALDVTVAAGVPALTAPVLAVAALAVRAWLEAPVLFHQQRAGRYGVPFDLVKLRTMRTASPGDTPNPQETHLTNVDGIYS
jgi:lipopolysaccharide/colanic/teichoic acid biosynthesis glycosyltransferase